MKEVFVFGAGASAASGNTPLGANLVWSYYWNCATMTPLRNGKADNTELNTEFKAYKRFLAFVGGIWPELEGWAKQFEDRGINGYNPPDFSDFNKEYYIDELLKILQEKGNKEGAELVKKLIAEHIVGTYLSKPDNKLYEKFCREVLEAKDPKEATIISFNFDSLLHEFHPVRYKRFGEGVFFDCMLDFDWIDEDRKNEYKIQNPFPLIKLNGSLDWGICRKCNKLHLYFWFKHKEFYQQINCRGECNGTVEPLIIIPHQKDGKGIRKTLEDAARDKLTCADKITIIGYSFPDYDQDTINLFRDSMNHGVKIEVVDYYDLDTHNKKTLEETKEAIKKRYCDMFQKETTVDLDGFQGYLEKTKVPAL